MKTAYVLIAVAALGCKKKEDKVEGAAKPTGGATTPGEPAEKADNMPAAFAAWDVKARRAAWQGAWSGDGEALGMKAAWQIDGDQLTMVDSRGEKKLKFELESPCSARFVESSGGGSSSTTSVFTLQNGQLMTGLGDAGSRKGEQAIVCGGGKIFTLDAKGCTEWSSDFGHFSSSPGKCGIRKDGGKDIFFYEAMGHETTLAVDGDVIWSEQLRDRHATKQPDLATAKKAQSL